MLFRSIGVGEDNITGINVGYCKIRNQELTYEELENLSIDRKSVVEGKSVRRGVDLCVRRIIKKKKTQHNTRVLSLLTPFLCMLCTVNLSPPSISITAIADSLRL